MEDTQCWSEDSCSLPLYTHSTSIRPHSQDNTKKYAHRSFLLYFFFFLFFNYKPCSWVSHICNKSPLMWDGGGGGDMRYKILEWDFFFPLSRDQYAWPDLNGWRAPHWFNCWHPLPALTLLVSTMDTWCYRALIWAVSSNCNVAHTVIPLLHAALENEVKSLNCLVWASLLHVQEQ